jgi:hypothetical protein
MSRMVQTLDAFGRAMGGSATLSAIRRAARVD